MTKFILASIVVGASAVAMAQPASFVDLGNIGDTTSNYDLTDAVYNDNDGLGAAEVAWFRFTFEGTNGTTGFLDIDTWLLSANSIDTEIGLYDSLGNMIVNDDDDGESLRSAISFGATTPARQLTTGFGNRVAGNGRDGVLANGTFWLAVGQFDTTWGATNWNVTSTGAGDVDPFSIQFRTDVAAVPEPATMLVLGAGLAAVAARRRRK